MIKLSFCQNDSLKGGSFSQKDSLITHMLFELCLFRNLAKCTFFYSPSNRVLGWAGLGRLEVGQFRVHEFFALWLTILSNRQLITGLINNGFECKKVLSENFKIIIIWRKKLNIRLSVSMFGVPNQTLKWNNLFSKYCKN